MMKKTVLSLLLLLFSFSIIQAQQGSPAYLDPKQAVQVRLDDLLSRMTLEEKVAQMCQYVGIEHVRANLIKGSGLDQANNDANAVYPGLSIAAMESMVKTGMIGSFLHVLTLEEANYLQGLALQSRLKIPLLIGIDAIHGNAFVSGCTVYPTQLGMASTWDTALVKKLAIYTAKEMRATGSQWAFSPNIDVARDPRWGRMGETFGEDPLLVSLMGRAMIKGLQGEGILDADHVLACAKHLVAGSEPVNGLNGAPTDVSERTLREIFLPPFKMAVDAGVYTVMPAHNEINGVPCHADHYLMEELLRKEWGFQGFYVSDWMDIEHLVSAHQIAVSQADAVEKTVNAGMDIHMHGPGFIEPLLRLVKEGKISEERINASVRRILEAKFKLGLFENRMVRDESGKGIFTADHQQGALDAARRSIILLKNNSVLPLAGRFHHILLTGPNANNQTVLGDWSFAQPEANVSTVLNGLLEVAPKDAQVKYCDVGGSILKLSDQHIAKAVHAAQSSDLIVVAIGENSLRYDPDKTSGENTDRDNIKLVGLQERLVQKLQATGKPVVVVLINSRPLDITAIEKQSAAIIEAWEPGSMGGKALAEIIFGQVNPSGKLTVTFPNSTGQIHSFYNHKPSHFARKFALNETGDQYEFGMGLSYTNYKYTGLQLEQKEIMPGKSLTATVQVTNAGKMAGEEVVQLYITGSASAVTKPVKELKGFRRVLLNPGETRSVVFTITPEMLSCLDLHMETKEEPGLFRIWVGGSSRDQDLLQTNLSVRSIK